LFTGNLDAELKKKRRVLTDMLRLYCSSVYIDSAVECHVVGSMNSSITRLKLVERFSANYLV